MYRNNPLHTGVASDVVPPSLKLKWKQTFTSPVVGSPVAVTTSFFEEGIINSRVYAAEGPPTALSLDAPLHALDAATGNIIWSFNPSPSAAGSWYSSPAVATVGGQTIIFIGRTDGKLYAIRDDGDKASKLWEYPTGAVWSSPVVTTIAGTQVVIVGSLDTFLYALVAATGALYPGWAAGPFPSGGGLSGFQSSPAILGSTVFIGNDNGMLYAVNLGNGVELWDSTTAGTTIAGAVVSSPAIANVPHEGGNEDRVFVGSDGGYMYAFTAATGKLRWSQQVGGVIRSSPALAMIPNPPVACAPGPTLAVIFGSENGNVYAMRATDGTPCWTFPSTGLKPFWSSPVVSGQTVYIGSFDFNFYAIDINTGTWQWSYPALDMVGSWLGSNPVVSGSTVYFGAGIGGSSAGTGTDKNLYAFEGPVATATLTSTVSTSTTTTIPVTQTSTVTTATATVSSGTTTQMQTTTQTLTSTVIASTVSVAPPGPVPGFPIESILMGLVGGLVVLTLLGRRRRRQSSPA
jgi:MYXO-CTERM domain-containing protein